MLPLSNHNLLSVSISSEHAEPRLATSKGPLTPSPKEAKGVTFNERVKAKKTIHISDFSEQEIESYWYTEEEFSRMKKDVRFESNLVENECLGQESTRYCIRGLENFTPDGANKRIKNKEECRAIVLEEQYLQHKEGSNDQEYIAEIYSKAVASARSEARALALQDEAALH